jgi:hypothetical protein
LLTRPELRNESRPGLDTSTGADQADGSRQQRHPGLFSAVAYTIDFNGYTTTDLLDIAQLISPGTSTPAASPFMHPNSAGT